MNLRNVLNKLFIVSIISSVCIFKLYFASFSVDCFFTDLYSKKLNNVNNNYFKGKNYKVIKSKSNIDIYSLLALNENSKDFYKILSYFINSKVKRNRYIALKKSRLFNERKILLMLKDRFIKEEDVLMKIHVIKSIYYNKSYSRFNILSEILKVNKSYFIKKYISRLLKDSKK